MFTGSRIGAVVMRHLYHFRRSWDRIFDAVYWPVIDLVLWGITTKWLSEQLGEHIHFLLIMLTAIVFWQIVWRANYEVSVNLLEEFWSMNLVNLFSTPLRVWEWICGVMLLGFVKSGFTLVVCLLASWLLYSLNIFAVGYMFAPFLLALMIFGWCLGLCASALIVRYGQKIQAIAWAFGFVLAPFCGVYYPVTQLPGWAQTIAWALPGTYVFDGMRKILQDEVMPFEYLIKAYLLCAVYLYLSTRFFLYMFEKRREQGLGSGF